MRMFDNILKFEASIRYPLKCHESTLNLIYVYEICFRKKLSTSLNDDATKVDNEEKVKFSVF